MKNYTVFTGMSGALYVHDENGAVHGGPYKNRKSAVGNEFPNTETTIGHMLATAIPGRSQSITETLDQDRRNDMARDDNCACGGGDISGHDTHCPEREPQSITASLDNYVPLRTAPPVDKIASSSAYGNVDPGWVNPPFDPNRKPFKLDEQSFMDAIVRPVGCYPAISKHEYQR